jgi:pimeloyl-ACP methyl ester carboxylesterase
MSRTLPMTRLTARASVATAGLLAIALLSAGPAAAKHPAAHPAKHHARRHHPATPKKKASKPVAQPAPAPAPALPGVRDLPVTFTVTNANQTSVPCSGDGKTYTISGNLYLPAGATPAGATLYAHGLGFGEYFWDFSAVPGYNYAAVEAQDGHASVIIDRVGYGASGVPGGFESCVGAQATILHEIIGDMRDGHYTTTGMASPSFSRVGLVGHSAGGEYVQIEAYSFRDIDALGVMDWADGTYSPQALTAFAGAGEECLTNGSPQVNGKASGYTPFGETASSYDLLMFANTDPTVEADATAMRSQDPCGDDLTILNAVPLDLLELGSIKVPVAFVWGTADAIYLPIPWWTIQEGLYSSSPKVTDIPVTGGHAVTLDRSAPQLQSAMNGWLTTNRL